MKANLPLGGLEKEKCFLKVLEGTRYKLFIQTGNTIGAGTDSVGMKLFCSILYEPFHMVKSGKRTSARMNFRIRNSSQNLKIFNNFGTTCAAQVINFGTCSHFTRCRS